MSFAESVQAENKKLELEAQKFRQENNLPGFWVPSKGENVFVVLDKEIREKVFDGKAKKIFSVSVSGVVKDWAVNPNNPIYTELIRRLSSGERSFVLLRTGENAQTRYEFLDKEAVVKV